MVNKWQTIILDEQQDGGTKSCDDIDTAATPNKDSVVESSARMDALNITVMVPMKKKNQKRKIPKMDTLSLPAIDAARGMGTGKLKIYVVFSEIR